jgi:hypothetical protein
MIMAGVFGFSGNKLFGKDKCVEKSLLVGVISMLVFATIYLGIESL